MERGGSDSNSDNGGDNDSDDRKKSNSDKANKMYIRAKPYECMCRVCSFIAKNKNMLFTAFQILVLLFGK